MSMVSYYNPAAMYRHQQAVSAQSAQFHHSGSPMHSWYAGGYHHQGPQVGASATPSYCMQDEQQMWHHPHPHSVFHQEFSDFVNVPIPTHHQQIDHESQLPSPPITVSGSELSSPGAGSGNATPPNSVQSRPPPVRSPYEWIKKSSYQTQPYPGSSTPETVFKGNSPTTSHNIAGKTRTKDKYRVVYTDHQRVELEKEFYYSRYITIRRKAELASSLGLSERQVKIWFQNRRAKERKQVKKREEYVHKENVHVAPNAHTIIHPENQQMPPSMPSMHLI